MNDLNRVVLIGRITADCKFGYLNSGSAKADFSIAVNRSKKDGNEWYDEVSYFPITVWGKTAENLHTRFVRGQQVAIDAYLKQDRWEKDGQKQSAVKIIVENIQLVGGVGSRGDDSQKDNAPRFKPVENQNSNGDVNYENGMFPEDVPNDIPF